MWGTRDPQILCAQMQGSMKNPYYNPNKKHHRPTGFQNNYMSFRGKRWHEILRWRWQAWRAGHPQPLQTPIPVVSPDLNFIHSNAKAGLAMQPAATWIGHITVLMQMAGLNILTDPVFSERCFPVQWAGPKRQTPPGLTLTELPHIDVVLLSHNHYDHMDEGTLLDLAKKSPKTLFLVPLGVEKTFQSWGINNVQAMDWWDKKSIRGAEFIFVPAYHWSARTLLDRNTTLWGGWVVKHPRLNFFFSGDTGYSDDFKEIGKRLGPFDFSAIAVGAYEPRWFMKAQHINPDEAVKIHQEVGSKKSIGVHWGTFELTDEPLDQPIGDLAKARKRYGLPDSEFELLEHGQTITLKD